MPYAFAGIARGRSARPRSGWPLRTRAGARPSSDPFLIKAARFPACKTLEEFDFTFQRSVKRQVVEHLGQLDFLHAKCQGDLETELRRLGFIPLIVVDEVTPRPPS